MMNSKMKMFEKSSKDVEKRGMKEGSKADMAMDKKQMMGMKKGYASGGVADMAGSQGKTETSSKMAGQTVSVRGVGAARAQKATIY